MALKTVSQLAASEPAYTEGKIRWDIFNADQNGLATSGALIKRGNRILIDDGVYLTWLRQGGSGSGRRKSQAA